MRYSPLLLALLALSGCVNAVRVRDGEANRLPGVPFYVKTDLYRQTTIYETAWVTVALEISRQDGDKTVPLGALHTIASPKDPQLHRLRSLVVGANLAESDTATHYAEVMKAFADLAANASSVDPHRPPKEADLVSNSIERLIDVDYDTTYYVNGPLPWFGSSKVTAELASDGTLTKASTESESKAAEALATLIPFKEYLSARFVAPLQQASEAEIAAGEARPKRLLTLRIEPAGYRYTLLADYAKNPCSEGPCVLAPLLHRADARWTRTALGEGAAPKKKEEGNAISFAGEVKLPKK